MMGHATIIIRELMHLEEEIMNKLRESNGLHLLEYTVVNAYETSSSTLFLCARSPQTNEEQALAAIPSHYCFLWMRSIDASKT
jgi:hypothetical protein